MPAVTPEDARRHFAAVREALRRGGGDTSAPAVRAVALAVLFAPDSPGRLTFADQVAEESAYAAWSGALADLD